MYDVISPSNTKIFMNDDDVIWGSYVRCVSVCNMYHMCYYSVYKG